MVGSNGCSIAMYQAIVRYLNVSHSGMVYSGLKVDRRYSKWTWTTVTS
jgi:hypothetical protein